MKKYDANKAKLEHALASIKRNYRTATPEKRKAMETLLGVEVLRDADNGLGSIAPAGTKLRDATDKVHQGQ